MNNDLISRSELLKHTHGGDWDGIGFSKEYVYVEDIINAPTVEQPKGERCGMTPEKMNNDLISRSALKEDLEKWFPKFTLEGIEPKTLFNQILHDIDNAPTVETACPHCDSGYAQGYSDGYLRGKDERPQGNWIFRSGVTCQGYYKCSICREVERAEKNFCPNCGAKMKGDTE